ncbi:MAG: ThuA domain-containing protein [Planctomycetes bacterium]|nr:ThuA domain-containing protein [Planctomycetota bacterium]
MTFPSPAAPLRILVWDEQQEAQKQVYPNYLGNHLAEHLKKQEGIEVRSVSLKDPDQGLSDDNVDWADVVVWWGHQKHGNVADAPVTRIIERVKAGKSGLVALHSSHYSKPFKKAMDARFQQDVLARIPEANRSQVEFEKIKEGAPTACRVEHSEGKLHIRYIAPACGLGGVRADAAPSHVETRLPKHPIAQGVPDKFDVKQTEMYNEAFTVPEPDAVIFFETWDKGEKFRAGCCWALGAGRVFYFRPGHETYPVFHQDETLKIVHNAVLWSGKRT